MAPSRRSAAAATAVGGVVAGHAAAYAFAYPDGETRAAVLHATGHGYWGGAVLVAVGAALAAFIVAGWRGAHRADVGVRLVPLAAGQVVLFASAEVVERMAAGVPPAGLIASPAFGAGILLQVVVAALALRLLRRWTRLVAAVTAPARRRTTAAVTVTRPPTGAAPERGPAPSALRTRAPPHLAIA